MVGCRCFLFVESWCGVRQLQGAGHDRICEEIRTGIVSCEVTVYLKTPYEGKPAGAPSGGDPARPSPSHALLARAAALYTGRAPEEFTALLSGTRGKPYFTAHPELHFSISHSADFWACAMNGAAVGLDVQAARAQDTERIARRFFHPLERAYLERCGYGEFFRVWAAKESYCKYTGAGIDGTFSAFSVTDGERLLVRMADVWLCHFTPREGYAACLCTGGAAQVRMINL